MQLINLTPHTLNVQKHDGSYIELHPSGDVARVSVQYVPDTKYILPEITVYVAKYGKVEGLPAPQYGVYYVVSGMVAAASPRGDVLSPGDLVRDENGKPIGCKGLKSSV